MPILKISSSLFWFVADRSSFQTLISYNLSNWNEMNEIILSSIIMMKKQKFYKSEDNEKQCFNYYKQLSLGVFFSFNQCIWLFRSQYHDPQIEKITNKRSYSKLVQVLNRTKYLIASWSHYQQKWRNSKICWKKNCQYGCPTGKYECVNYFHHICQWFSIHSGKILN